MNHDIAKSAHSMVQAFIAISTAGTREAARNAMGELRQGIDSYVMQTRVVLTYDNAAMYAPSPGPAMLLPAMSVGLTAANGLLDMAIKGGPGAAGSHTFVQASSLLHMVRRQFWTIGEILEITGLGICSRVDGSRLMNDGRTAYNAGRPCEAPKELLAAGKDAVMAWEAGWRIARDDDQHRRISIEQTPMHLTKAAQATMSASVAASVALPANDGYRFKGRQAFIAGRTRTDPMGTLYAHQLQAWMDGWDAEREACIDTGRGSYGTNTQPPEDWTASQVAAWSIGIAQMQAMADRACDELAEREAERVAINDYDKMHKATTAEAKEIKEAMRACAVDIAGGATHYPPNIKMASAAYRYGYFRRMGMASAGTEGVPLLEAQDHAAWEAGRTYQTQVNDSDS